MSFLKKGLTCLCMCVIMYNMRQASVRQLQHNLKGVMRWVDHGEEVQITRRDQVIARLVPDTQPKKKIKWPDFNKRLKALAKKVRGRPLSEIVIEGREERF